MKTIKIIINVFFFSLLFSCSLKKQNDSLEVAGLEHVKIGGELKTRLNKNFDRLEEEYYQPVNVYWTEEESNGWPGDKEGRTILGLTMDARATGRKPKYLDEIMSMLPSHLNAKGYLGSIHADYIDEQQLSGNGWVLRGLNEYYEWTKDEEALAISKTIVDSLFIPITSSVKDYPISSEDRNVGNTEIGAIQNKIGEWAVSSDVGCIFIAMDGVIHAYKNAPNPETKKLIDELVSLYLKFDLLKMNAQTHASLSGMRGLVRYAEITGDTSLVKEVENRWLLYKEYGMTENFENYNWFNRYDTWSEPCAIVDSYLLAVQLWKNTGKTSYLEDADEIYWNAISMTQRANGGFGLDKCVGPANNNISVSAYEAYWCCSMRGGEGLGRAAEYSYFVEGDKIIIPFYREGELHIKEKHIDIKQETEYPFGNNVILTFNEAPEKELSLMLFVPDYMNIDSLSVNGIKTNSDIVKSFIRIRNKFKVGDKIQLNYTLKSRWVKPHSKALDNTNLTKAMFGPLVLCCNDSLVSVDSTSSINRISEKEFTIDDSNLKLVPLYHLLDSVVSDKCKYEKEVLFNVQTIK